MPVVPFQWVGSFLSHWHRGRLSLCANWLLCQKRRVCLPTMQNVYQGSQWRVLLLLLPETSGLCWSMPWKPLHSFNEDLPREHSIGEGPRLSCGNQGDVSLCTYWGFESRLPNLQELYQGPWWWALLLYVQINRSSVDNDAGSVIDLRLCHFQSMQYVVAQ
jgi:hypothetical protein